MRSPKIHSPFDCALWSRYAALRLLDQQCFAQGGLLNKSLFNKTFCHRKDRFFLRSWLPLQDPFAFFIGKFIIPIEVTYHQAYLFIEQGKDTNEKAWHF